MLMKKPVSEGPATCSTQVVTLCELGKEQHSSQQILLTHRIGQQSLTALSLPEDVNLRTHTMS